jgi:CheY-like chemotaxis protein
MSLGTIFARMRTKSAGPTPAGRSFQVARKVSIDIMAIWDTAYREDIDRLRFGGRRRRELAPPFEDPYRQRSAPDETIRWNHQAPRAELRHLPHRAPNCEDDAMAARAGNEREPSTAALETGPAASKGNILIVDDEAGVRHFLEVALQRSGYIVWTAGSGEEALDVFRRHQDELEIALLDVRMPGLDGPQTLKILKQLKPALRCCLMSGFLDAYNPDDLTASGAGAIVEKPFHLAQLLDVLEHLP